MSKLGRVLLPLVLWFGSCTNKLPGQDVDTTVINISVPTMRHWALSYREFSTEFLDCLYGRRVGDSIKVVFTIPADVRPSRSTPDDVTPVTDCVMTEVYLGDAHSHPRETAAINGQRFHIDPNTDQCYLSKPDQDSFRADTAAIITVVVCGVGQFMVWVKGDSLDADGHRCVYDPEYPRGCAEPTPLHKQVSR
jgi:hypothetical protein